MNTRLVRKVFMVDKVPVGEFYLRALVFSPLLFLSMLLINKHITNADGPGSSVGIANELRAGRSGDRIPVGVRFSAPVQTGPGAHPVSCTMGTGSFPGVKYGRGVTLTTHPLLVPTLWATPGL
jgi:hypothetical protein